MKTKVYITVRKESKSNPNGEITYDGIMEILGVFTSREEADKLAKEEYEEFYKFQWNNYVVLGDHDDLDGLFRFDEEKLTVKDFTGYDIDGTIESTKWEVLEWESE